MSRQVQRPASIPVLGEPWYCGLDPSLTGYGVVFYQPSTDSIRAVTVRTAAVADGESPGLRMRSLHSQLLGLFALFPVDLVCMERAAYSASGAYTGGLCHAMTAFALIDAYEGTDADKPIMVVGSTLKKFVSGKGTGHKSAMMMHVLRKWGYESANDNIADAYGLARLAAALRSGSDIKYEQQCLDTVGRSTSWLPQPNSRGSRPSPRQTPRSSRRRTTTKPS